MMAEGYRIVDQRQTSTFVGGRLQTVWSVSYVTDDGDTGQVEIPLGQYTAAKVHEMIGAEVAELIRARQL
jgi:hypothetical protein